MRGAGDIILGCHRIAVELLVCGYKLYINVKVTMRSFGINTCVYYVVLHVVVSYVHVLACDRRVLE